MPCCGKGACGWAKGEAERDRAQERLGKTDREGERERQRERETERERESERERETETTTSAPTASRPSLYLCSGSRPCGSRESNSSE